jgi:tripartite-type tricarboxylate transporter receptor subunit TctC
MWNANKGHKPVRQAYEVSGLWPRLSVLVSLLLALLLSAGAHAQSANTRPIRMIVPLPSGTATDLAARVLAQQMSALLGQSVLVDNKPGANGTIAVADLLRSAPDGNTVLLGSNSSLATNVALIKNISYDPRRDFAPINGFGETMHVLMVKPGHPAKSFADFIAMAKQSPGKISVGITTSAVQVQVATFSKLAGMELLSVPYKGIPATITDVIGGNLEATMVDLANAMAHSRSGQLRPLAVTSLKRNPLVSDWPAIAESFPGFDFPSWVGLVGPAGMPQELINKYNAVINQALKHPEVMDKLVAIGMSPMGMSPDQFKTYIHNEVAKWIRLAKEANVQPE